MSGTVEALAKAKARGKECLVTFRRLFLPAENDCMPAKFHYKWADILLNGKKNFAVEAFRESAKSSLVLRAFPIHILVYPKESLRYGMIIMATQRSASKKLREIADTYLNNPFFRLNLKEIKEQSERAFEVIVFDENNNEVNVRIEAYGCGSSVRGSNWKDLRPQIIIIDDPQDIETANSDNMLDNDWEWFLSDIYFLSQHGRVFIIGNNLGAKCIIERIMEHKERLNFDAERVPVMDANMIPAWPEYHPLDKILAEKENFREIGKLGIWFREKMCVAISPDSQMFKKDKFKYFNESERSADGLSRFITVDLAISQALTADFTSICTVSVNADNHWFIEDIDYGRYDPTETIDRIFDAVAKYRPQVVGIEKVAYQAALHHFLQKEMIRRNKFFIIEELKAERKKELRIQALQPRFNMGTIWFKEGADYLAELETELETFPRGLHDKLAVVVKLC